MREYFGKLFDSSDYPPRWSCGNWTPAEGWIHIIGDLATWGAYTAIPLTLAYFILRRQDMPFPSFFWLFAAFIFACGTTHLIDAILFWNPVYRLSGMMKIVTAAVSWATVIAMVRVTPFALTLPGLAATNRRLEEEIRERTRAELALRDRERLFGLLANSAPVLIWLTSPTGRVEFANDQWQEFTGISDALDTKAALGLVFEEDRSEYTTALARTRETHTTARLDCRLRRADGELRWCLVAHAPRFDEGGEFLGLVSTALDITERKRMEDQEVRRAKLESLGLMAGGIAHDFNNLLVGVLGHASLALETAPADDPVRPNLEKIEEAAMRASELTNQMLAFAGGRQAYLVPTDVNRTARRLDGVLRETLPSAAQLRWALADSLPAVKADATQLGQILLNLVANAGEAISAESGGNVTISTRTTSEPGSAAGVVMLGTPARAETYVELAVADQGAGMTQEQLRRAFDPFYTTKFTGRGLGLSVVLGLVKSHKGAIVAESTPKSGTRIRILFPALGDDVRISSDPPAEAGTVQLRMRPRVLVVDDEVLVSDVAAAVLRSRGCAVTVALGGQEALEVLRAKPDGFDLVLLDRTMEDMDGADVLREIRVLAPQLNVICCTGYQGDAGTLIDSDGKPLPVVHKPYRPTDLVAAVNAVLETKPGPP